MKDSSAFPRPMAGSVGMTIVFFLFSFTIVLASPEKQSALVRETVTGDTLRLEGGKNLRAIGLQAPPIQSRIPLIRQYGQASFEFHKTLVQDQRILLEWDAQIRDDRGNLMAYVFLQDGTFVNKEILKAGHARLQMPPPNKRYAADLRAAELEARRARRGVWKEEPENPYLKSEYLGEKNTKIYYFPTSPELERIPEANLVTFRSRIDAKASGYRPCSTCKEDERVFD